MKKTTKLEKTPQVKALDARLLHSVQGGTTATIYKATTDKSEANADQIK